MPSLRGPEREETLTGSAVAVTCAAEKLTADEVLHSGWNSSCSLMQGHVVFKLLDLCG